MAKIEIDDLKITELAEVLGKTENEVIEIMNLEVAKRINEKITSLKRKQLYEEYKNQLIALKYQGD